MLMIVNVIRERPPVSPMTKAGPGAMIGARARPRPVAGARPGEGQRAGVHCAVENISEA